MHKDKAALVVGINLYDHHNPLMSSVKDARDIAKHLQFHYNGEANFNCDLHLSSHYPDKKITRERLHKSIEDFFGQKEKGINTGIFYFSGHGCESNLGGYLMTQDSRNFIGGVSVNDILICANNSCIPNIIIILDCCYGGHMGSIPSLNSEMISLRHGITVMSSSNKHETALENLEGGYFTQAILFALNGCGADLTGKVDVLSMYIAACRFLQKKAQTPTLKTSMVDIPIIRKTTPQINEEALERITEVFYTIKQNKPLSPRFLSTSASANSEKVEEFELLQQMNTCQLLRTEDNKPLEEVARASLKCQLTNEGKFRFHQMTKPHKNSTL